MNDRLKQISLRKFREQVADLWEVVEVSKRDADGNIRILGYWTPYAQLAPGAVVVPIPDLGQQFSTRGAPIRSTTGPMVGIEIKGDEVGTLDIPVDEDQPSLPGGSTAIEDGQYVRVRTPEEAATAVAVNPVRAVPKPSQRKKR